jgi:hypothetical protein
MSKSPSSKFSRSNRRTFLKSSGLMTAVAVGSAAIPTLAASSTAKPFAAPVREAMPTRNLGKTGYKVGIFSLGGQAALEHAHNEDMAVPIIEKALDLGVNYIDTSSIYGGPERWSEQYVGKVMKNRRAEAFLATKTKERTKDGSEQMLEKSLKLLQTDHIDLWQLHDIGTMTDIDEIFAKGGAMEALIEARDQKIVKYLGITGHYRPGCADGGDPSLPVRRDFDGGECCRPTSLQLLGAIAAAGGRKANGHHRNEGSGARTHSLDVDTTADRTAEAQLGGNGGGAPLQGRLSCVRRCTIRSHCRSAR